MKENYKLSKSNKVFFLVISTLYILRYLVFINKSFESFGYLIGTLFSFFLFSIVIALLVWFISGKKNKYGSIAFNIMLAFTLLAQFSQFLNSVTENN
jgi:hypothetical protein